MYVSKYTKPFRILLVDDDPISLKIMGNFISSLPFEVFMESNAEDALKLLKSQDIDIIFSDHLMPGKSGIEFLEEIAGSYPEIIRVLVTGKAEFNDLIYAINNADLYRIIIKPINRIDFISIIETAEEISKKKYLEKLLLRSEKSFENLVNSMLDAVIVTTPDGVVNYVNPFAEKLWGKTSQEFKGNSFRLPLTKEESTEIDIISKDKIVLTCDLRTYDIFWQGEKALLSVVRDISQRKEIEDQLKETIEKLSKANDTIIEQQKLLIEEEKLDLLLQISGATAHELSQPLTVLMGNIEILKYKEDIKNSSCKNIDAIYSAAEKISSIVRKFQAIRHVDSKKYTKNARIINLDQKQSVLYIDDNPENQIEMKVLFADFENMQFCTVPDTDKAFSELEDKLFDLIIITSSFKNKEIISLKNHLKDNHIDSGLIVIIEGSASINSSNLFHKGIIDIIQRSEISRNSLKNIITKNIEINRLKKELVFKRYKILELSQKDQKTGLYNHSFFHETLKKEISAAKKGKKEVSLCLLKINKYDDIKSQNHQKEFEKFLKIFSQNLAQLSGEKNTPSIFEENLFALILPETSLKEAESKIEEAINNMENISFFINDKPFKITLKTAVVSSEKMEKLTEKKIIDLALATLKKL